jgi:hypothetical protein
MLTAHRTPTATWSNRKVHLPFLRIDMFADPGDRPFAVHDAGGLKAGMRICYLIRFDEDRVAAELALETDEGGCGEPRHQLAARFEHGDLDKLAGLPPTSDVEGPKARIPKSRPSALPEQELLDLPVRRPVEQPVQYGRLERELD